MTARTLHIPAASLDAARLIAHAVDAGRVPCLAHYLDAGRAKAAAEVMTAVHRAHHAVFTIELVDQVTDDGRIRIARLVDQIGEIAAAFALVAIFPALAARFWGIIS